jgi:hypothetical protein
MPFTHHSTDLDVRLKRPQETGGVFLCRSFCTVLISSPIVRRSLAGKDLSQSRTGSLPLSEAKKRTSSMDVFMHMNVSILVRHGNASQRGERLGCLRVCPRFGYAAHPLPGPPANRLHWPHEHRRSQSSRSHQSDYDSPWKEALELERFFPEFLALLFPTIHARIDWRAPPELLVENTQRRLDKEGDVVIF